MLIRSDPEGALAIGQLSHAWLSGQLARAWGNERFGGVEPHEDVALGAEQHDVGWALFDLEPRWNPDSGLPRSFLELTVDDHLDIWVGAPEHLLTVSEHAALVVSMHGSSLSELRQKMRPDDDSPALQAHIDEEHARQAVLRERLGVSEEQAERTRRQMWTWDGLSLALCNNWRPFTARDVPAAGGELVEIELSGSRTTERAPDPARPDAERARSLCTLDPWPFAAETVRVQCQARRLAPRYEDEAAMRSGFESAAIETITFALSAKR